jgi:hypothetical protein
MIIALPLKPPKAYYPFNFMMIKPMQILWVELRISLIPHQLSKEANSGIEP